MQGDPAGCQIKEHRTAQALGPKRTKMGTLFIVLKMEGTADARSYFSSLLVLLWKEFC